MRSQNLSTLSYVMDEVREQESFLFRCYLSILDEEGREHFLPGWRAEIRCLLKGGAELVRDLSYLHVSGRYVLFFFPALPDVITWKLQERLWIVMQGEGRIAPETKEQLVLQEGMSLLATQSEVCFVGAGDTVEEAVREFVLDRATKDARPRILSFHREYEPARVFHWS